jgi:hypothetical protein
VGLLALNSLRYAQVERVVAGEFSGQGPHEVFKDFEEEPIASASIAQARPLRGDNHGCAAVEVLMTRIFIVGAPGAAFRRDTGSCKSTEA